MTTQVSIDPILANVFILSKYLHVDAEMQKRTIKMFRNIPSKVMDSNFLKLLLLVFNLLEGLISCLRFLVFFYFKLISSTKLGRYRIYDSF